MQNEQYEYNKADADSIQSEQIRFEMEKHQKEKTLNFLKRLEQFNDITSLEDAKNLAEKILPVSNEINTFKVGNAKCTVVNRSEMFRISVDTLEQFISYDFV